VLCSALGIVLALLLLSNGLSAALFLPLLIAYALLSWRSRPVSLVRCIGALAVALAVGLGTAAVYVMPLLAHRGLFDLQAMPATHPGFELGRWFGYATLSSLTSHDTVSGGLAVPVVAAVALLTLSVAVYAARTGAGPLTRVSLSLTLLLGLALLAPGLGPALILSSGLRVSAFETPADSALMLLLSGLATLDLGILSYCSLARTATRREQLMLVAAAGTFLLTVPWSAPVWAAVRPLALLQFPFRFIGVLSVAAAGLFAAALDRSLGSEATPADKRLLLSLGLAALVVIGAGVLAWGVPGRFRKPATAESALALNVDVMFRSYVAPEHLPGLARRLGTAVDSFSVTPTALDETIHAEFTAGTGSATVTSLGPRTLRLSARCDQEARVRIGQLYSPLWRIRPAAVAAPRDTARLGSSAEGLIELSLGPGPHDLELVFDLGWSERWGVIVTAACLLVALGGSAWSYLAGLGGGVGGRERVSSRVEPELR
jgi:hypothetical protein